MMMMMMDSHGPNWSIEKVLKNFLLYSVRTRCTCVVRMDSIIVF